MQINKSIEGQIEALRKSRGHYTTELLSAIPLIAEKRTEAAVGNDCRDLIRIIQAADSILKTTQATVIKHPWRALAGTTAFFFILGATRTKK